VALFRGINVGKAKRIAMADLRALLGKLGYTGVATLLNSGNAVFTGTAQAAHEHADRIRKAVLATTGVDALVIVKSAREIAGIIAENELAGDARDPSRLLVALTHDAKALTAVRALARDSWGEEQLHVGRHAAYLWCANGILESQALGVLLKLMNGTGTTRNWATVNKVHALMNGR
jgi:uncharacterized protein (DUF1697 family)